MNFTLSVNLRIRKMVKCAFSSKNNSYKLFEILIQSTRNARIVLPSSFICNLEKGNLF